MESPVNACSQQLWCHDVTKLMNCTLLLMNYLMRHMYIKSQYRHRHTGQLDQVHQIREIGHSGVNKKGVKEDIEGVNGGQLYAKAIALMTHFSEQNLTRASPLLCCNSEL